MANLFRIEDNRRIMGLTSVGCGSFRERVEKEYKFIQYFIKNLSIEVDLVQQKAKVFHLL